ncbi:MAG TPA: hypothetical protein VFK05_20730 [Polyangiaceae bacterium]|nr:hypothetical protein [Polyangiaceae bacterium]
MIQDRSFVRRWLISVGVSGCLGACAAPAAQAPLSGAGSATDAPSKEFPELGTFVDHGAPKGVGIWLRVPVPGRDIPLLCTLLGVGSVFDLEEVLSRKLGPTLSHTVDLAKPVDLTSGLDDGATSIVLAVGIRDASTFGSQVSRDFQVVHQGQGRWRLTPKTKPAPESLACELWQAARPVGARLVCATQAAMIEKQGEFLMAAARSNADQANFHAELPGSAAQDLLQKAAEQEVQKHRDAPTKESASESQGREMGRRWVSDFARELSGFSWDLTLRRDSVELSQEIALFRPGSLLSTSLWGRDGAGTPVPEAFWRLPSDSDGALYLEGAEPERIRRQAASLMKELRTAMAADDDEELPPIVLDRLERTFSSLILRGGAFELAFGQDLDQAARVLNEAASNAIDRGPRSGSADPALKKARAQLGGWALLGIEDDSRAYLQALREALRLAADKTKYGKKGAKPKPPSPSSYDFPELPLPPGAGLPADALHFALRSKPNPKYLASKAKPAAPAPNTVHVFAVADTAQHVWFALSSDEALALTRLRAVLNPVPEKTLGASEELRQLEKQRVAGLGFGTLSGFSGLGLSAESKAAVLESRKTLKQLWSLPKRGGTRIPIWLTRAQAAKGPRRIAIHVRLTPDAIADVLPLIIGSGAESGAAAEQ